MDTALDLLVTDGVVDEVLGRLKSGKEADIFLVRHGADVLAAKVYKERNARNFKNNVAYKEGRMVRNSRTQRAMSKGSKFGQKAAEDAWKTAEADALYKLHASGARVPKPILFYEGILLMELVRDAEGNVAPRLIDTPMSSEQASSAYAVLRQEMVKMLCADLIHGDLSPYNVLMGTEGPVIIDFPQVVGAAHNRQAEFFFRRDLDNIRTHLGNFDASLLSRPNDAYEIWREYTRRDLTPDFVPTGQVVAPKPPEKNSLGQGPRHGQNQGHRPKHGKPPPRGGPPRGDNRPTREFQPNGSRPPEKKPSGPVVQYVARPSGTPPTNQASPKPPESGRPPRFPRRRR